MILTPFNPNYTSPNLVASVTLAATNVSQNVTLPANTQNAPHLQIANQGTTWAFVNLGTTSLSAATVAASYPVAPGSVVIIAVDSGATTAAVILASGTGNVTFSRGEGM